MAGAVPDAAAALSLTLFGPMQVLVGGRPLPRLRSRKALWLLALLALRGGRPVEREWLAATLWPDMDPEQSLASLRTNLSELRKALGAAGERVQSTSRHAVRLDMAGAEVDVDSFDRAMASGTPAALARAAALHTGPLLEGCAEEWVGQERTAREQDCLRALQALGDAALAAGDSRAAADFFRRAVAMDPWAEAARRGRMLALAQGGDTNAALLVYRDLLTLLRDDPRAVPDAQTSALYDRLRAEARQRSAAPALAPSASPAPARPATRKPDATRKADAPARAWHLPSPLTELVGREEERMAVAAQLRRSRLVTLTGPGGIGKTRLALQVAAEAAEGEDVCPDGVWLTSLEALSDGAMVERQVASVLGLNEALGRTLREGLTRHLREKRLLLVLDNCEHLLGASADVAGRLLRECAGVRVLATSREPLGITGEVTWRVPALSVPDPAHLPPSPPGDLLPALWGYEGVRLFVERATEVQATFSLSAGNARLVADVCARLEGIPLAIELAAARVRALTVAQIAARLDDRLGLLQAGGHAAPARQQTLRATLDWSYELLTEAERTLLGRLSVFAGGWTLSAAEAVCAGGEIRARQVVDLLASLVDKSLVHFAETGLDSGEGDGAGRYRLLETVRQYAAEHLEDQGETARVRSGHRDHFLAMAEEAEPLLTCADQEKQMARLGADQENLRAALAWCGAEPEGAGAGLRLAAMLWRFWETRGQYSEGRASLAEALGRPGAGGWTGDRAKALNAAGVLAAYQNDYTAARVLHQESLAISRELSDRQGVAWSLNDLGRVAAAQGDHAAARAPHEESLAIFRELGHSRGIAVALHHLGGVAAAEGDAATGRALYEESLALSREIGDKQSIAWALNDLGTMAREQGDFESARAHHEESLAISRELSDQQGVAWSLNDLGTLARRRGDRAAGRALHEESLTIFTGLAHSLGTAWALHHLGELEAECGADGAARARQTESLALFRVLKSWHGIGRSLSCLGRVAFGQGDRAAARAFYAESAAVQWDAGERAGAAAGLEGLASVLLAEGEGRRAVRLWGAAQALREALGSPANAAESRAGDRQREQARTALGEAAYASAWQEGLTLPWADAIKDAKKELRASGPGH